MEFFEHNQFEIEWILFVIVNSFISSLYRLGKAQRIQAVVVPLLEAVDPLLTLAAVLMI